MPDFKLTIAKDGKFYCRIDLKADFRNEAIEQANEIMNRFAEPCFTANLMCWNRASGEIVTHFN